MWLLKIGALLGALQFRISRIVITHDHKRPGQWGCVGVGGVCLGQMTRKGSQVRVLYGPPLYGPPKSTLTPLFEPARSRNSSGSVDIGTMIDPIDVDDAFALIDPIDDPVLADPSAVATS